MAHFATLLHEMGIDDTTGEWYAFWSGFAGIFERLIELMVIGGMLYWHHSCHIKGCWRMGRHQVPPYAYCRKHLKEKGK